MKQTSLKREHESFSILINAPAEKIFPLACPVEEEKWFWNKSDYTMLYSDSGNNENNCIFKEEMSGPHIMGSGKAETTYWVTTLYDKVNYIIHWLHIRPSTVTKFEVINKKVSSGATEVTWDMTITALKEEAHSAFDETMKDRMKQMMEFIGLSLKHYCETGTKLTFEQ